MVSALNWQYFRNQFFTNYRGLDEAEVASFLSWIPIVGGVSGAAFFGFVSDALVTRGYGILSSTYRYLVQFIRQQVQLFCVFYMLIV
eukprot:TRINITY_DN7982_c0_g1_i1.p1 TRINITY_DN7982_c0_g1~~TRINITY_DN7982_c0_g1_i1.p1  ORF type:complete len:87 (+),score=8.52 TRINITY_DN7982_c0_g1_i1:67-327(+)